VEFSWHAVGFLFTLTVGVYTWIANGQRAHRTDLDNHRGEQDAKIVRVETKIAALEQRVGGLENRVVEVVERIAHLPTQGELHDLTSLMIELRGEVRALRDQSALTSARVARFEDYLVESGR